MCLRTFGVRTPHSFCGAGIVLRCPQVFIRELISNASDALEKLRHKLVSEGQTLPEMEIHLQTDAEKGTVTIQVPSEAP